MPLTKVTDEKTVFDIDERSSKAEQTLERIFIISILFKLIFGALESLAGVMLLFVQYDHIVLAVERINSWVFFGYQPDLSADSLADQRLFVAIYAIMHGVPKVILALVLIRRKLWGYPLSLVILLGFIAYQLFEIAAGRSVLFMWSVTIFDLFVIYLIVHEWRRDKELFDKESKKAAKVKAAKEDSIAQNS